MSIRSRLMLLWGLFLGAAGVAGFSVHRLYRSAQQEIAAQSERTVQVARIAAEQRIREHLDGIRRTILIELAGFHEDGLANSLQRWNAANEVVRETFLWDANRGLAPVFDFATASPTAAGFSGMWREFAEWRAANPELLNRDPVLAGTFEVAAFRTLGNPSFPSADLRYQAENLDMLRDAGRVVDPWAGWAAAKTSTPQEWFLWYQAGPEAIVRGCVVSSSFLVHVLRSELGGDELARVAIVETDDADVSTFEGSEIFGLSGYRLRVEPGEIFAQKAADARWGALIAAGLLGLFLLGAAALTMHTWREARDATRKINFVTQVSHELRTPLTSIQMFADMLAAPALSEDKRIKFAGTIGAESVRLGELIERLLALNALAKGVNRAICAPFDVVVLVREVVEEMGARLRDARLEPALQLPETPLMVRSDRNIVKQALLNLFDNACKYARDGGWVGISVASIGDRVTVRVADQGTGIPAEIRDRLFEPFVQGGRTLTSKSPGVGLGLSLTRGLLRQAGAELALVPSARGAMFEINLPSATSP